MGNINLEELESWSLREYADLTIESVQTVVTIQGANKNSEAESTILDHFCDAVIRDTKDLQPTAILQASLDISCDVLDLYRKNGLSPVAALGLIGIKADSSKASSWSSALNVAADCCYHKIVNAREDHGS